MIDYASKSDPKLLALRYGSERRFRYYGAAALVISVLFLMYLIADIGIKAWPSFFENKVTLEVNLDPAKIDANSIAKADFTALIRDSLRDSFPNVTSRAERKKLNSLISVGAADDLRAAVLANPASIGTKLTTDALLSDDADLYFKGMITRTMQIAGKTNVQIAKSGEDYLFTGDLSQLAVGQIIRTQGGAIRLTRVDASSAIGEALIAPDTLNTLVDGNWNILTFSEAEANRRLDDRTAVWLETLRDKNIVSSSFATRFFTSGDSREPELAGLRGAIIGSLLTLVMTLSLSVPLGIAAAVYLEEFAPKNRWTELIEVNINNLAAVPSIIFGLLGLAVFINFFGLPRSAPLVGGLVLALLVLPTIIIASRAALKAVPPSIKEAALGVGASHQQAVFHHVLPLAMPGILTGTILGVARALGETAPLLMIGMVAFIVDVPKGFTEAATVLPVQIYLWSDLPEIAFQSRTAAAIIVLLVILFCLNAVAIYLRKRFERRW